MEEYKQITLDEWTQWKEDIRKKLAETANNFVYIGYRLKQIRDSGMYGGAADVFEFAQNEYGLGRSTVSRFIAINEKYSEGGNSLTIREEFRNYSSSKLSEMLTMPDNEIELINERTTIRAIRELKKFGMEDPEKVQEEEAESNQQKEWTPLEKCIIDFFRSQKDMLDKVMELLEQEEMDYKLAAELMVPSGQAFHKKGIVFLFMYEWNDGVKYKLMTSPDPVSMTWREFLNIVYGIFSSCTPGNVWKEFYGEQDEEKTENVKENQGLNAVATSQQNEDKTVEKAKEEEENPAEESEEEPQTTENRSEITENRSETTENVTEAEEKEPETVDFLQREADSQEQPEKEMEEDSKEIVTGEVEKPMCDTAQGFTVHFPAKLGEKIYKLTSCAMDKNGNYLYRILNIVPYLYEVKMKVTMYYHEVDSGKSGMVDINKLKNDNIYTDKEEAERRLEELNGKKE